MSKIYYIEDHSGKYLSENGTRRFTRLEGKEAYDFLNTPEGRVRRFMKLSDYEETADEVFFEVHANSLKSFRKYERHEQYVADTMRASEYITLSMNALKNEDGEEEIEECIADEDVDIESEVFHKCDLETLRNALKTLSKEEHDLITALYLQDAPITLREYANKTGIHFTTVDYRVKRILEKLKKYF